MLWLKGRVITPRMRDFRQTGIENALGVTDAILRYVNTHLRMPEVMIFRHLLNEQVEKFSAEDYEVMRRAFQEIQRLSFIDQHKFAPPAAPERKPLYITSGERPLGTAVPASPA